MSGSVSASYNLGNCYLYGRGVVPDFQQAVELYQRGVKQGYAPSQRTMAFCYENGNGVARDPIRANELFVAAAQQGDVRAIEVLASKKISID